MTWTQERSYINSRVLIGAEATGALGTVVPSNKILQCFDFVFGIDADVASYRATGRKYTSTVIENTEWTSGTMSGPIDYNGIIYPLASAMGKVTAVAHGSSATAKDWIV